MASNISVLNEPYSASLARPPSSRSEEHTSELQSQFQLVCRLLLEKKNSSERAPKWLGIVVWKIRADVISMSIFVGLKSCADNVFFFNDTAATEIYTLSLHDALPI